jgi:hypothetical protein
LRVVRKEAPIKVEDLDRLAEALQIDVVDLIKGGELPSRVTAACPDGPVILARLDGRPFTCGRWPPCRA